MTTRRNTRFALTSMTRGGERYVAFHVFNRNCNVILSGNFGLALASSRHHHLLRRRRRRRTSHAGRTQPERAHGSSRESTPLRANASFAIHRLVSINPPYCALCAALPYCVVSGGVCFPRRAGCSSGKSDGLCYLVLFISRRLVDAPTCTSMPGSRGMSSNTCVTPVNAPISTARSGPHGALVSAPDSCRPRTPT